MSRLPMRDDEFGQIEKEVWLYTENVPLSAESALALLGEAIRARENEQQLIARVRALELPGDNVRELRRRSL
jgi:hypothetical protein